MSKINNWFIRFSNKYKIIYYVGENIPNKCDNGEGYGCGIIKYSSEKRYENIFGVGCGSGSGDGYGSSDGYGIGYGYNLESDHSNIQNQL